MQDPLASLNEQQRQVVQTTHGPVLVLAGAGSGKTRALTHRIAYLISQGIATPHEIVAVTFTNKAAREMRERLASLITNSADLPHAISTFHGLGVKLLREQHEYHARSKQFVILDAKESERFVRQAVKEENLALREWNPRILRHRISEAKNEGFSPKEIVASADNPNDEVLGRIYTRYERLLAKNDAYDFDDLLLVTTKMLQQHELVRNRYQNRWRFLSVDEYQDTNPIQEQMLRLLLGSEKNICVVGDDYQAIYSWRGANVDHILRFESAYPACTTIYLTQNYRSTPQILTAANQVIAKNTAQKHKKLWTRNEGGHNVQVLELSTDRAEVGWIRKQIVDHVEAGGRLRDCAVLYRTNAQSRVLEEEFLRHRVPYTIIGGFRFYDRREVKDALAFLYWWVNPNSRLSFERIADALLDRVGPKTIDRWEQQATAENIPLETFIAREASRRPQLQPLASAFAVARKETYEKVSDLLRHLLTKSGYLRRLEDDIDGEERSQNIEELFNVASAYTDIHTFLEDVALLSDIDNLEEESDRVTCMTLHASKGLEFPIVFLVGCEDGLLPHINSFDSPASVEEERRLMYVGMTRARKRLVLTHAAERYVAGEMTPQLPSRFLENLPETVDRSSLRSSASQSTPQRVDISQFMHLQEPQDTEPVMLSVSQGEFVVHPRFGQGVVIDIHGKFLTCVFAGHGVQTIDGTTLPPAM